MKSAEVSSRALQFFAGQGHTVVPSASLIADDPTLLLINAGMAPFKPYFLGEATPPYRRATSVQKCVRTVDIEEVGKTARHGSFFQMFGNFSFGDYFKEEAIGFAWEFLTRSVADGGLGMPEERLWVTVYTDDDEAENIWRTKVGVPADRIQRLGMADNFWSMGVPGPCGPASEICFDRGPEFGREGGPVADDERYMEIWNLVFMQNIRGEGPVKEGYPIVGDLPSKNIDTGFGLERIAALQQGVDTIFDIDTTRQILDLAAELSGTTYGKDHKSDVALRVVADHILTSVMLIGDGVTPANDGRGYVLRRILRRAVRTMRLLGSHDPVVHELAGRTIDVMSETYTDLSAGRGRINNVAVAEEAAFADTLKAGTAIFDLTASEVQGKGTKVFPGDKAFQLHDTYGFPIDVTLEMAAEAGLTVDEAGFRSLMAEQRQRAKEDAHSRKHAHADLSVYREWVDRAATDFTGFTELTSEATVLALLSDGVSVPAITAGATAEVILDRSPLYAESGGQIADRGTITGPGVHVRVDDVQKIAKKLWVHKVTVESGQLTTGDVVLAQVDPQWRRGATQGHSGTHMVHAALRQVLGPNAVQAGSLNKPGYLRFDFNWHGSLTAAQKADIEGITNEAVSADYPVNTFITDLAKAREMGAMALFGENYGNQVRVVEIGGPFSMELCAGTHVQNSAQIGPVTILGESSVGSGVRRVEAFVGLDSYNYLAKERALLAGLASSLKVPSEDVPARVGQLVERLRAAEKELEKARAQQAAHAAGALAAAAQRAGRVLMVTESFTDTTMNELRSLATGTLSRFGGEPAVVVLLGVDGGKVPFVVSVNKAAQELGAAAGELVRSFGPAIAGRGGGKADIAQGSGTNPAGVAAGLAAVRTRVAELTG